jgi:5'-nucleotidase
MLASGSGFLAGPQFNASLEKGVPFYDAIAMDLIGYDAVVLGSHDFDFGPETLADFILSFTSAPVPFVSANLDVSAEPRLQALVGRSRIARSVVVERTGERIGIVGATTPRLAFTSSPRGVRVDPDVAAAVQAEIDDLEGRQIDKIILLSSLQSLAADLALVPLLRGLDLVISGGGHELLANPGDRLLPGDEGRVYGAYPLQATDADGKPVYVVTTSGGYRYVGRLTAGFDRRGRIILIDTDRSGPVRVAGGDNPDAVAPDPLVELLVADPVADALAAMASHVLGTTEVSLDGQRSAVRTRETNEGNLVADALFFQATQLAERFGVPTPHVAIQNGGGIRNDSVIPPGSLTELDTFAMLPFANFVSLVPDIPATQFKEILENAVSRVEFTEGRFAQISGFHMIWDAAGMAQVLDAEGQVVTPGTRIRQVALNDGTALVTDGVAVPGAPALHIATIDFLARGGDQSPYRGATFVTLGVTYQQALRTYLEQALGGVITDTAYPEGGEGRITRLN